MIFDVNFIQHDLSMLAFLKAIKATAVSNFQSIVLVCHFNLIQGTLSRPETSGRGGAMTPRPETSSDRGLLKSSKGQRPPSQLMPTCKAFKFICETDIFE